MGEKSDNRANPGTQKRENINKGGKGTLKGILLSWLHQHNIMCLPVQWPQTQNDIPGETNTS